MERFKTIELETAESTNTYARSLQTDPSDVTPLVVITDRQTAGRGQRGNTWESEYGKNLTFSLVLYPRWMSPARQFELSMLVSIGITNALRKFVQNPEQLAVKWPNDIYYGDKKLAGILIENSLGEKCIERSVIGIGLNVNQLEFTGDAPNPVSLIHVNGGKEHDRQEVLQSVVEGILDMTDDYADNPEPDELAALYNNILWRNNGKFYSWLQADGEEIQARIAGVDTDGRLRLELPDGRLRTYLFKEISAVI